MSELDEVANRVAELVQGSVLALPSLPFLSTKLNPLHPAAQEQIRRQGSTGGASQLVSVGRSPTGVVALITQTCDLQRRRTLAGRDLVQVAQVVSLTGREAGDALSMTKPQYVPLPWYGDDYFVDLDHVASVDRAALMTVKTLSGPEEADRRDFAYLVGRYYSRAAFPDDVVRALSPLQKKMSGARNSALLTVRKQIEEIRVLPDPPFDSLDRSHLTIYFLINSSWYPDIAAASLERTPGRELFKVAELMVKAYESTEEKDHGILVSLWRVFLDRLTDDLTNLLVSNPDWPISGFTLVPVTALKAKEYRDSDVLDLGHISLGDED